MARYFIEIAYNGKPYHGWQIQHNGISVQATLNNALTKLLRQPVMAVGCGRTDTGVHASQYFAHFYADSIADSAEFLFKINHVLDSSIVVKRLIDTIPTNAHARFDATYRAYDYFLHFRKDPFKEDFSYYYGWFPLDVVAMKAAAQMIWHYDDFPMFCKTGGSVTTTICTIFKSELYYDEVAATMRFHIAANRFLRGMIRLIMGALIMVGKHKISLDEFEQTLNDKKFRFAKLNVSAPPQGLFLSEVRYAYI